MLKPSKKEYFQNNKSLNKESITYRTFCRRTESLSPSEWPLAFNKSSFEKIIPKESFTRPLPIQKPIPKKEIKDELVKTFDPKKKKGKTIIEKEDKRTDIQKFFSSNLQRTTASYRTFRDRVNKKGMTFEEALTYTYQRKSKSLSKLDNEKTVVISKDIIYTLDNSNLITEIEDYEKKEKEALMYQNKEAKKNICYLYHTINTTKSEGKILGVYVIIEEIEDGLYEVMNLDGDILKIVEGKFIKRIK